MPDERREFIRASQRAEPVVETFCLTLAYTGARISEVLALTPWRIHQSALGITIESLKMRKLGVFRTIPITEFLLERLSTGHGVNIARGDNLLQKPRI